MKSLERGIAGLVWRFWQKVDRRGPDECWLWLGSTNQDRYGRFNVYALVGHNKLEQAHRFAHMLTHGYIDPAAKILHRCDNPPCCNPAHLFQGSHSDNMKDMYSKQRHHRGRPNVRRDQQGRYA